MFHTCTRKGKYIHLHSPHTHTHTHKCIGTSCASKHKRTAVLHGVKGTPIARYPEPLLTSPMLVASARLPPRKPVRLTSEVCRFWPPQVKCTPGKTTWCCHPQGQLIVTPDSSSDCGGVSLATTVVVDEDKNIYIYMLFYHSMALRLAQGLLQHDSQEARRPRLIPSDPACHGIRPRNPWPATIPADSEEQRRYTQTRKGLRASVGSLDFFSSQKPSSRGGSRWPLTKRSLPQTHRKSVCS